MHPRRWQILAHVALLAIVAAERLPAGTKSPAEAQWQETGLESYRRGAWLTEDPTTNIIERIEQPVPKMLAGTAKGRESVIPETLAGLAWMFGSERSRFHGDPRLARLIVEKLMELDERVRSWRVTDRKASHRFSRASTTAMVWEICHSLRQADALFGKAPDAGEGGAVPFPEATVAELEKSALASARVMAQPTAQGHAWVWRTRQPWRVARLMTTMMAGYKLSGDKAFLKDIPGWFRYLEEDVHDLGGLRYSSIDPLPNVQWYTDHTLKELANLYLMAVDDATEPIAGELRSLFGKLKDTYIYRALPAGTYDYSAVPWLKRLWHNPPGCFGPAAVALITGDGRNATIARYMAHYYTGMPSELRYVTLASLKMMDAIRDVEPEPIPNRYIVKDDSLRGVRGLLDDYSFVLNRGPALFTVVGAKVAKAPERRYLGYWGTYSTVLQGVTPEVGNRPWGFGSRKGYNRRSASHVTAFEFAEGDRIVRDGFAALAASYRPQKGSYWGGVPQSSDWQVHQLWLAAGKRLIGLVTLTSLKQQTAPYVAARIHFAFTEQIELLEEDLYRAQDFTVRVVESSFPNREVGPSENYVNEPKPRGKEIRLADHPTDNAQAQYRAAQSFHCLLDIDAARPAGSAQVERVTHEGLLGVKAVFAGAAYLMLYRTERDALQVVPSEFGIPEEARILAGETAKSHWLDRRHPSRDPEDPSKFYYLLPQHGLLLATWSIEK